MPASTWARCPLAPPREWTGRPPAIGPSSSACSAARRLRPARPGRHRHRGQPRHRSGGGGGIRRTGGPRGRGQPEGRGVRGDGRGDQVRRWLGAGRPHPRRSSRRVGPPGRAHHGRLWGHRHRGEQRRQPLDPAVGCHDTRRLREVLRGQRPGSALLGPRGTAALAQQRPCRRHQRDHRRRLHPRDRGQSLRLGQIGALVADPLHGVRISRRTGSGSTPWPRARWRRR